MSPTRRSSSWLIQVATWMWTRTSPFWGEIRYNCESSGTKFIQFRNFLRYYRSGNEIYRQAKVYLSEGDHSSAYILFMRYLTLFVEKIVKHPQFKEVPADAKKAVKTKLAEILPITENLKKKLLERYNKEYEQYLIDQENERKRALEEAKRKVNFSKIFVEFFLTFQVAGDRRCQVPQFRRQQQTQLISNRTISAGPIGLGSDRVPERFSIDGSTEVVRAPARLKAELRPHIKAVALGPRRRTQNGQNPRRHDEKVLGSRSIEHAEERRDVRDPRGAVKATSAARDSCDTAEAKRDVWLMQHHERRGNFWHSGPAESHHARLDSHASEPDRFPQLRRSPHASWLPNNDAGGERGAFQVDKFMQIETF